MLSTVFKNFTSVSTRTKLPQSIITSSSSQRFFSYSPEEPDVVDIKPRRRVLKATVELTSGAAARIQTMLNDKDDSDLVGVKIGVKRRGCNGLSYTMNWGNKKDLRSGKYEVIREHDVNVLIDPKATFYIAGTVMDWVETELSTEFTFINPNSKGECGCGESFNV